jgi:DNA (cytosine-5)-methyltransferase 1
MEKLNGLDLFSGIGGISLALSEWVKTVCYCENDKYAQGVLLSRMSTGELDYAPIWDDVNTLTNLQLPRIDIIFGGFPCTDISIAGAGAGLAGKQSGLFFQIIRLTNEIQPAFVFLENVAAIKARGLDQIIKAFTEVGYDCRWTIVSAAAIGAPHKRERWFMLAHPNSDFDRRSRNRSTGIPEEVASIFRKDNCAAGELSGASSDERRNPLRGYVETNISDTDGKRLEGSAGEKLRKSRPVDDSGSKWWETEPDVGRVVDELPFRVDRIKCLGNSVVPAQAKTAFKRLMGV